MSRKGIPNKRTQANADAVVNGVTPLKFMLDVMYDEKLERSVRLDAAKAAAPYVHPKLANVVHDVGDKLETIVFEVLGKA